MRMLLKSKWWVPGILKAPRAGPSYLEPLRPRLCREQRRFQFGSSRLGWLLLSLNWKMSWKGKPTEVGKKKKMWTGSCRERASMMAGFVQTLPRLELVFIVDGGTAGQVGSTWPCIPATFWLFHVELRCIFHFWVYLFFSSKVILFISSVFNFKLIFFIFFPVQYWQWCCVLDLTQS